MKTYARKTSVRLLGTLALALVLGSGGAAWAQDTPTDTGQNPDTMGAMHGGDSMSGMKGMHMMGMHAMPATVDSVDMQTGLVGATAEGMPLKLHFPPSAVANLKSGDRITLHMGFTKP
ncbi:hypothetical protein [Fulvimonas yonginensis]|uniref:Copper-binding protein n=1 Tax=Fulvimonas yonginensis TaxID=1495200 RepID=A0ABU8JE52_9GAMM